MGKKQQMIELSLRSVAENKKELIKELKDYAWKLEHGVINVDKHNESWVKLNYGCRSLSIKPIEVKRTMDDCLNLLN